MSGHLPSEKSLEVNSVIDEFILDDFKENEQIGSGGEGEVYRSYNDRLGKVAIKRLFIQVNKTEMREVILLAKHSNHPNIIRLFGLLTLGEGCLTNSRSCIGYVMEYMESGSLSDVIHNPSVEYDMKQAYSWIEMTSSGLQYLHEKGVLHRDIKPQNILLGKSLDDLRISDFGLAKAAESQTAPHTCGIGTKDYMAPELHQGTKYDKSADIYTLTITFWEIIHRKRPYDHLGEIQEYKKITRIVKGERPNIEEKLEISALLIRGWDSNPESRPKISEFIEFSRKAQENLRKVVCQQNSPIQNEEEFNSPVLNQRLEVLEVNVAKIAVSNAENSQLKEEITASKLNQDRIDEESSQKVSKSEQDLSASKTDNVKLSEKLEYNLRRAAFRNNFFERPLPNYINELLRNWNILIRNAQKVNQNENKIEKEIVILQNTSVLILGGDELMSTIYLLDSKTQSWKKLRITLPMGMRSFGAVVLNEELYVFGGYSKACYKLKDDGSWIKLASLNQGRAFISSSSLVYKGDIWVIGGTEEDQKSVEKYNISQDKWTFMPEMNYGRSNAAASVFLDRIFVTGGWNRESLKSVEILDPKLQKWILFCDLPFGITGHTMLISNSTLSIFGGYSRSGRLNSVWEMDIEDPEKKWTQKQNFKYQRESFGIEELSNGIIVFGSSGNNGETSEIFDGNKWIDGPELPQKLSKFAYTSISQSLEERFLDKFS